MSRLRSISESLRDDNPDICRRRLLFRCWHRGTKEGELILGSFGETCLTRFDSAELSRFEALLDCGDTDLFDWMIGGRAPTRAGRLTNADPAPSFSQWIYRAARVGCVNRVMNGRCASELL
jgi:succinate dehydrogenase flavin-adding protein (antitoxin of CptAB toxin-antitoxin module)